MYTWKVHWNCQNCLLFKHLLPTRWRKYMQVLQSVLLPTGWIFNKIWWVDGHWDKKITLLFGGLVLIIIWITDTDWLGLPDHDVGRQELTYLIYTVYFFLFCSTPVLSILLSFLYPYLHSVHIVPILSLFCLILCASWSEPQRYVLCHRVGFSSIVHKTDF